MFWENYEWLCEQQGKSPNKVASELGYSSGSVTAWKQGRVPKWDTLQKIAEYFQITVNDLISDEQVKVDKKVLNNILALIGNERGAKTKFCEYLNLPSSIIGDWKSGRNKSYKKRLPEIADYFDVSTDYLLTGEPSEQKNIPLNAEASNGMKENETIRFYTEPAQSQTPFLGVMPTSKPYFAGGQPLDTNTPSPSSEGHSKSQAAAMELDELSSTMLQLFSKLSTLDKCKIISTLEELSKEK